MTPTLISAMLIRPSLPSSGIQEIMRMMFEVQNGTVQRRKRPMASSGLRIWKTRKYATQKPMISENSQVRIVNLTVS
jgi:hypothetical protein